MGAAVPQGPDRYGCRREEPDGRSMLDVRSGTPEHTRLPRTALKVTLGCPSGDGWTLSHCDPGSDLLRKGR
ncbi:hypothetical protein NDU88_001656 [Pleurodeles waltl]|uniref:Uncharacterized protein n=1 Tax=Pleurodeles waltl TaxID=8319 RepID=A0AAV7U943_PLEWA|nr:hypothetical protein NDU88_001656 [Pleurodeles waltl]